MPLLPPYTSIAEAAAMRAADTPDEVLIMEKGSSLTASQMYRDAVRLASALRKRGVKPGDRITSQLPNWSETSIIALAAMIGGFVLNPILPMLRRQEVRFALQESDAVACFFPARFRDFDFASMYDAIAQEDAVGKLMFALRADQSSGFETYESLLASGDPAERFAPVDPDAASLLLYTSGTTGRPKGVLHSQRNCTFMARDFMQYWGVGASDIFLVAAPVGHISAAIHAHFLPWIAGSQAFLMDRWNVEDAAELIETQGCTIVAGANQFVKDLISLRYRSGRTLPTLRLMICGGETSQPDLIRAAGLAFRHCLTIRLYGMTEVPSSTAGAASLDELEYAAETDGRIANTEIRISDPVTGDVLPFGREGEVLLRGDQMLLRYLRPEDNEGTHTEDGFFKSGDLGRILNTGHLLITGRKKDLIIRSGENISAREIEATLLEHKSVYDVAVIALPSETTGEAVCAVIVPIEGHEPCIEQMADFVTSAGLAKQKVPEAWWIVDSLPRNASGKILKNELRKAAAERLLTDNPQGDDKLFLRTSRAENGSRFRQV
jgi:cyclohexanecarboxylate-CoA ligase